MTSWILSAVFSLGFLTEHGRPYRSSAQNAVEPTKKELTKPSIYDGFGEFFVLDGYCFV